MGSIERMLGPMRLKLMPWIMVLELAIMLRQHWRHLERSERAELRALVAKSQGRPSRLTAAERMRVRTLVAKLEPWRLARGMVPIGRRAVRKR